MNKMQSLAPKCATINRNMSLVGRAAQRHYQHHLAHFPARVSLRLIYKMRVSGSAAAGSLLLLPSASWRPLPPPLPFTLWDLCSSAPPPLHSLAARLLVEPLEGWAEPLVRDLLPSSSSLEDLK